MGEMGLLFRFDFGKKTPGPRLSHWASSPSPERPCCLVLTLTYSIACLCSRVSAAFLLLIMPGARQRDPRTSKGCCWCHLP